MSFSSSSQPLTLGIPIESLGLAPRESGASSRTVIRRVPPERALYATEMARLDASPAPVVPTLRSEGLDSPRALGAVWQLAVHIGQLLGSGTPRSLSVRGHKLDLLMQGSSPERTITTLRCA
jgi:hypothetical protein